MNTAQPVPEQDLADKTVLVTGGNRGIGRGFCEEFLSRGAKVYVGSRQVDAVPTELLDAGATAVQLDVTDGEQVAAAASQCGDVNVVINNAGYFANELLVRNDSLDAARQEMEVNYFGVLRMTRAFAPVLAQHGGGNIVNVLSVAGMVPTAFMGGYSPAKAACLWLSSITRSELRRQDTTVTALIVGSVDTDMAAHVDGVKEDPRDIARAGIKAMRRGDEIADTDRMAVEARARYAIDPRGYERALGRLVEVDTLTTGR